jgi:hypothetical protein
MVVRCGRVVRVSIHVGILMEVGSSWGEKGNYPMFFT